MRRHGLALAAALLALGCVEGEPRFFDDESALVTSLRVNAYADEQGDGAIVEVHGMGADGVNHAFAGAIRFALEAQNRSTANHTYDPLQTWVAAVTADNFSTPTVPFHSERVDASQLLAPGTYRVWANATIGQRTLAAEPALFAWP